MANIKSQIKRNRQSERHHQRNVAVRSRLRTEAKKIRRSIESGESESVDAQLRETGRLLDKAASRGVIHKRTAARRKSRLARAAARD
jgi:small subunit ribosomal protein S20